MLGDAWNDHTHASMFTSPSPPHPFPFSALSRLLLTEKSWRTARLGEPINFSHVEAAVEAVTRPWRPRRREIRRPTREPKKVEGWELASTCFWLQFGVRFTPWKPTGVRRRGERWMGPGATGCLVKGGRLCFLAGWMELPMYRYHMAVLDFNAPNKPN